MTVRPILEIGAQLGLQAHDLIPYGHHKAKVSLDVLSRRSNPRGGRYVLVTAMNPTPLGEGKTTTAIGLVMGLCRLGHRAVVTLRQPSLGPVFGMKGGGAGGGRACIVPMEEMNLHLTGDSHAVQSAHNLLASVIDNHLFRGNALGLDPERLTWPRAVSVSDRALRRLRIVGKGGAEREIRFVLTEASEVMAILALAGSLRDLRARLGRIVVGTDREDRPVTAEDLRCAGAMAALLKQALLPNLMQTAEGTPAFVHAGPFSNIAHGNSSVVADALALGCADYVVTEAGFASELGAEKFFNIKCRVSGMRPEAAVIVVTVRGLKVQSGNYPVRPGRPLSEGLLRERPEEVVAGAPNLRRHIAIVRRHGVAPVVAINAFPGDHPSEHEAIAAICDEEGVRWARAEPFTEGGEGVVELARHVEATCDEGSDFRLLYPDEAPLWEKIETIATEVYGASGVSLDLTAERQLERFEKLGWGSLPVCMAKTHLSLTHDPKFTGAPTGWNLPVRRARAAVGAGFVLPMAGDIRTMPGLGSHPSASDMDLDEEGNIVGLS